MKHIALAALATLVVAAIGLRPAVAGAAEPKFRAMPDQLQFGESSMLDGDEERLAKALAQGTADARVQAASDLWRAHSLRHATAVLQLAAGPPLGGERFRALQREVDAATEPDSILQELRDGDYPWGAWLAFLRPHEDLVPVLLAALKDKPGALAVTILALGNSGDRPALEPLVKLLENKDGRSAGVAAQALGYFGDRGVEVHLIKALSGNDLWLRLNACGALGRIGTARSVPHLKKLLVTPLTGTLNVQGAAAHAIASIERRENRGKPGAPRK